MTWVKNDLVTRSWCDGYTHEQWAPFLHDAYVLAFGSRDPSTQNGAIALDYVGRLAGMGNNNFPHGVSEKEERWERPIKYKYVEHAERNAIYESAALGRALEDGTLVAPWAACCDCARAIIQSGIIRLVRHKQACDRSPSWWIEDLKVADEILVEGGVEIIDVDVKLTDCGFEPMELRHSGDVWTP